MKRINEKQYKAINYSAESLNSPESIADMLNTVIRLNKQAEEHVYMIALNTKGKPLGVFEISHGTVNLQSKRNIYTSLIMWCKRDNFSTQSPIRR